MNRYIYLDHAATTYVKKEVLAEMYPYLKEFFGNASSVYNLGNESKTAIENARAKIASSLNCQAEEIFFTSGGTESDNWAIKGVALANHSRGNHIITSAIEHPAVIHSCKFLEQNGFEVTYLPVNEYGMISIAQLKASIKKNTILISVMYANNEVGTIQPIQEIGQIAEEKNVYFHTDAVQAIGHIPIDIKDLNIDLLSLSAHKIYGPKGIGALFIKNRTNIDKIMHGGSQEKDKRAGTENVAGIVGFGKAIEITSKDMDKNNKVIKALRDRFVNLVSQKIPDVRINGHPTKRLPGNANISFELVNAKNLLSFLDERGIYVSSGSACSCASLRPSHVLLAMNLPQEVALSSLRFTFGNENTENDIDFVVDILSQAVEHYGAPHCQDKFLADLS
ncbi:cysteine desulfurase NifS [Pelotomaculum terephthalicicum JT]|uniref:cysteine desulfurase NifS n=1 Tax=Pelotomaculum terephthalicicum TaxID=206393 RepID=UPI001F04E196|nr:cysteine desulfurase NifS [Pelotomaculum terephthalicicum]MCG9968358.1 cysteine desulfurase NifS [Pelotomaculum terephthalicicum JT]